MVTVYKHIKPADVYRSILKDSNIEETEAQANSVNEYGNYASGNNFMDLFAGLILKYGSMPVKQYAAIFGVEARHFTGAIIAMSGMTPTDWVHEYLNLAACEMIENTDWKLNKIAGILNFSQVSFSRFFKMMNKYQPYEWRMLKRYGKKSTYHFG